MTETFLRHCWYVAAWPHEIGRTPLRRLFLEQPVVLFRRQDGTVVALADSCPHRFVPLSLGQLVGDEIECCYHGLRFDQTGACTRNPHGDGTIPRTARVAAYPTTEAHGAVWIWLGDAARADPALIPDLSLLTDPAFRAVCGLMHVAANYQLITDNLLDLSHVQFLHPGLRVAGAARMRHEMAQQGNEVISYFWRDDGFGNGLMRTLGWPEDKRGDTRAHMHWHAPSLMVLDVGITEVGGPVDQGIAAPSVHLLTPETARSTHYFWGFLRNVDIANPDLDARIEALGVQAFAGEDKPVIEAQQAQLGTADIMTLSPTLLTPDAAGTRARRVLAARLAAE